MHFYLLGGSGRTGSLVIEEAIRKGHTITTLARDSTKIAPKDGLTICQGTPTNKDDVDNSILRGGTPNAVLVTLSAASSDNPFASRGTAPDTLKICNFNVISAMKKHSIPKIVILQAMGVGDSFPNLNFLMRAVVKYGGIGEQFRDHEETDKLVRSEAEKDGSFKWVIARPPMLKGEEFLPVKVLGDRGDGASFMPSCSRASVARFMVEAAEGVEWDGKTPVIVN